MGRQNGQREHAGGFGPAPAADLDAPYGGARGDGFGGRGAPAADGFGPAPIVMTGIPLVDTGFACDGQRADGERCFLEPGQRQTMLTLIAHGADVMLASQHAAIANAKLSEATKKPEAWSAFLIALFEQATGPLVLPLAKALARYANSLAMPAAELGLKRAAWTLAGADSASLKDSVAIVFRGMRRGLSKGAPPKDRDSHTAFLTQLQGLAGPAAIELVESCAAMSDADLLALYGALKDPEVASVATYAAGIAKLLAEFDANRIDEIGERIFGTRELAVPMRVRVHGREYVALLESFGVEHSALALNGEHAAGRATTMDSLIFVRMVERSMHGVALEQYRHQRTTLADVAMQRQPATDVVNFDDAGVRASHPWFAEMYRAIKAHPHPEEIAASDDGASMLGLNAPLEEAGRGE